MILTDRPGLGQSLLGGIAWQSSNDDISQGDTLQQDNLAVDAGDAEGAIDEDL